MNRVTLFSENHRLVSFLYADDTCFKDFGDYQCRWLKAYSTSENKHTNRIRIYFPVSLTIFSSGCQAILGNMMYTIRVKTLV